MDNRKLIIPTDQILPRKIPIIPLSGKPIFPGIFTPVMITSDPDAKAVEYSIGSTGHVIGFLLTKEEEVTFDTATDFYQVGTAARIVKKINLPDGGMNILLSTIRRFKTRKLLLSEDDSLPITAVVEYLDDIEQKGDEITAMTRALITEMKQVSENNPLFSEEVRLNMVNIDQPGKIADFITSILNIERTEQQKVLEMLDVQKRLEKVLIFIKKEQEVLRIQKKIQQQLGERIEKSQREYFLKEQLKEIQRELGVPTNAKTSDYLRLKEKIEALSLEPDIQEPVMQELEKFSLLESNNPEYGMVRNYLELIADLPWNSQEPSLPQLSKAVRILNRDHYGLEDVKERILEFLSVKILQQNTRASILCLVGPPGVGKTSVGKSITSALNRRFFRFSVGGMRDEAEIKGHRRTYIGSMPGKILQGLKTVKSRHAVFMIDEIDKLGISFQGDPASALLEVLDPEQNIAFRDHYLDLPFDISDVFFIATANTLDTIPSPLLDRMEIIHLAGYVDPEKVQIARRYLLPKSLKRHGLTSKQVQYSASALKHIASSYSREAGVRNYEKQLDKIHRKIARKIVENTAELPIVLSQENLKVFLGEPTFNLEPIRRIVQPGLCIGLAWTSYGGEVLVVEAILNLGKGALQLTGQIGDVMKESANIALSYVRSLAADFQISQEKLDQSHIHLHIPAGATPKDGPSAGITMATTMLSLLRNKKVRSSLAMTGELSLVGDVLPIGGLREKLIAAKRNRIKQIIIPYANQANLEDIPDRVKKGLAIHLVKTMSEVTEIAF